VCPMAVWADAENLAPTRSRSPERPASSESLYRLRFSGPRTHIIQTLYRVSGYRLRFTSTNAADE